LHGGHGGQSGVQRTGAGRRGNAPGGHQCVNGHCGCAAAVSAQGQAGLLPRWMQGSAKRPQQLRRLRNVVTTTAGRRLQVWLTGVRQYGGVPRAKPMVCGSQLLGMPGRRGLSKRAASVLWWRVQAAGEACGATWCLAAVRVRFAIPLGRGRMRDEQRRVHHGGRWAGAGSHGQSIAFWAVRVRTATVVPLDNTALCAKANGFLDFCGPSPTAARLCAVRRTIPVARWILGTRCFPRRNVRRMGSNM